MSAQHLSDKGAAFIARFEGFASDWYLDPVGIRTIGYGHTGKLPAGFTVPLTREAALRLLKLDAEHAASCIREDVHPPFVFQHRFDAVCSFVYNLGCSYLEPTHTIGRALQGRARRGAADAFLLYDHAGGQKLPGLTARRKAERRLFLYGRYS